jgi:hypothetical protein
MNADDAEEQQQTEEVTTVANNATGLLTPR